MLYLQARELSACGKIPFVDVSSNNKNYNDILECGVRNCKGRDSNHFDPTGSMKRDEASKILARVFGYATQTSNENIDSTSFSDLPAKVIWLSIFKYLQMPDIILMKCLRRNFVQMII